MLRVVLLATALALTAAGADGQALTPREIMQRNFVVSRVADSSAEVTFTLVNQAGQERVRKTVSVSKLRPNSIDNMRLVRFREPPDVRGTAILTIEDSAGDDDIWIYLPALRKVRRLVGSSKRDSYAGTDFSYGDIIGHRVDDWTHRLLREEDVDRQPCYVIESLPVNESVRARSGYARRLSWARRDNFVMVREEFWDLAGQPLKVFRGFDVRLVDPAHRRWQAMRIEATNLQTGHRTTIRLENFKVNQGIGDDLFTTRHMERAP